VTVAGVEVVAVRDDVEVEEGQQVLPERERRSVRGKIDADVAKS
jgi:hypothetical protein